MAITINDVKIVDQCRKHGGNSKYPDTDLVCFECQIEEGIPMNKDEEIIEELADLEHQQWEYWSKNIGSEMEQWYSLVEQGKIKEFQVILTEKIRKWKSNWKPYFELSTETKEHDRIWARKILPIIQRERESSHLSTLEEVSLMILKHRNCKKKHYLPTEEGDRFETDCLDIVFEKIEKLKLKQRGVK